MTRLRWEEANEMEKEKKKRRRPRRATSKTKLVHPNSTAALKWGRTVWVKSR